MRIYLFLSIIFGIWSESYTSSPAIKGLSYLRKKGSELYPSKFGGQQRRFFANQPQPLRSVDAGESVGASEAILSEAAQKSIGMGAISESFFSKNIFNRPLLSWFSRDQKTVESTNQLVGDLEIALNRGDVSELRQLIFEVQQAIVDGKVSFEQLVAIKGSAEKRIKSIEKIFSWVGTPLIPLTTLFVKTGLEHYDVQFIKNQISAIFEKLPTEIPNDTSFIDQINENVLSTFANIGAYIPDGRLLTAIILVQVGGAIMRQKIMNLNESLKLLNDLIKKIEDQQFKEEFEYLKKVFKSQGTKLD